MQHLTGEDGVMSHLASYMPHPTSVQVEKFLLESMGFASDIELMAC